MSTSSLRAGIISPPNSAGVSSAGGAPKLRAREAEPLELSKVLAAVENIRTGKSSYQALVYLQRAGEADLGLLLRACKDSDLNQRWARMWMLSGTLARLMRFPQARENFSAEMQNDIVHAHFLQLFSQKKNAAADRIFKRIRNNLLRPMLRRVLAEMANVQRLAVLRDIIEKLESDPDALVEACPNGWTDQEKSRVLGQLHQQPSLPAFAKGATLGRGIGAKLMRLKPKAKSRDV